MKQERVLPPYTSAIPKSLPEGFVLYPSREPFKHVHRRIKDGREPLAGCVIGSKDKHLRDKQVV